MYLLIITLILVQMNPAELQGPYREHEFWFRTTTTESLALPVKCPGQAATKVIYYSKLFPKGMVMFALYALHPEDGLMLPVEIPTTPSLCPRRDGERPHG